MRPSLPLALAAVTLALGGCHKSHVAVALRPPGPPAAPVTRSGRLLEEGRSLPAVRTVAIRAPWGCGLDAGPAARGASTAARVRALMQARCGVWLTALEEALGRAGIGVVAWRALAAAEAEDGGARGAAARLGADTVLVVHALDATPVVVDPDEAACVVLERSSPAGELRGPAALSPSAERAIRGLVRDRFPDGEIVGVATTLEVTAVTAGAEEPFWRYRHARTDELVAGHEARVLVRGRAGAWRPVRPTASTRAVPGGPAPLEGVLGDVARTVAADLVAHLQGRS